jgi:hypothetical protein
VKVSRPAWQNSELKKSSYRNFIFHGKGGVMIDVYESYMDCGVCGMSNTISELYVSESNSEYEFLCRKHFYEKYKNCLQNVTG